MYMMRIMIVISVPTIKYWYTAQQTGTDTESIKAVQNARIFHSALKAGIM